MRRRITFLIFILSLFHFVSVAQQNRFVYIQTENKQTFYVKINNTFLSSSSSGYLVIPKLKDGSYPVTIGFPKSEWPQQELVISINKKDAGYLLKNFGDKGWGIFNLQTMDVIMSKTQAGKPINTSTTDEDPFTQVLADVVNTPELKQKAIKEEPEPKKEEPAVVINTPKQVEVSPSIEIKPEPIKEQPVVIKEKAPLKPQIAGVKRIYNSGNEKGRELVYVDLEGNDTIRLFIPSAALTTAIIKKPKQEAQAGSEKFLNIELPNPNIKKDTVTEKIAAKPSVSDKTAPSAVQMVNSDCKGNATDEDFIRLRKKMAAGNTDDEMVSVAKKAFRLKCYSTSQIKNLGVLFLNDAGRYQFFDAAYPYVYDTSNFSILQQQLNDPYFITRFQAMIRR